MPTTIGAVRDCGFHAALTVEAGRFAAGTNRFLIPRFEVPPQAATRFPPSCEHMFSEQGEQTSAEFRYTRQSPGTDPCMRLAASIAR